MRIVRCAVVVPLWAAAGAACAAPPPLPDAEPVAQAPCADTGGAIGPALARARGAVRAAADRIAREIDRWFSDQPLDDDQGRVSDGMLSLSLLRREGHGVEPSVHANARFELPGLQRRAHLFIGRDNERDVVTDQPQALSRQQRLLPQSAEQTSMLAGVGVALARALDLRLGVRGGLKPYAQARWRRRWEPDVLQPGGAELRQTFFWSVGDHLGSTTALVLERGLSPSLALHSISAATITQAVPKVQWNSTLGASRAFGAQRRLSLDALAGGGQTPGVGLSTVGLQLRWEQPLHQDWLQGELVIGRYWPRQDASSDLTRGWALGFTVRMRF